MSLCKHSHFSLTHTIHEYWTLLSCQIERHRQLNQPSQSSGWSSNVWCVRLMPAWETRPKCLLMIEWTIWCEDLLLLCVLWTKNEQFTQQRTPFHPFNPLDDCLILFVFASARGRLQSPFSGPMTCLFRCLEIFGCWEKVNSDCLLISRPFILINGLVQSVRTFEQVPIHDQRV